MTAWPLVLGLAVSALPTVEIAPGVHYPWIQMGACTTCSSKAPCCGTNLTASLPSWSAAQGADGVTAIDTQLRYNDTRVVAQALAALALPRARLWITTKVDPKAYCGASDVRATVLSMVRENLRQLNTSYADLLLLHEPCDSAHGTPQPADQAAWGALQQARQQGWVRAIGLDKFNKAQLEALTGATPAVLMAPMSLSAHDDAMIAYCAARGITYNAYGVMAGCKFSDPTVLALAARYSASASQVCGAWTRQRGCTMALGFGTDEATAAAYIREDLDIFRFNMTDAEVAALDALASSSASAAPPPPSGL